ncbi:MAG: hypothetical protein V3581_00365 [Candidatus Cardinium sp.]
MKRIVVQREKQNAPAARTQTSCSSDPLNNRSSKDYKFTETLSFFIGGHKCFKSTAWTQTPIKNNILFDSQ